MRMCVPTPAPAVIGEGSKPAPQCGPADLGAAAAAARAEGPLAALPAAARAAAVRATGV